VACVLLAPSVPGAGLQGRPVPDVLLAQHLHQEPPAQRSATQSWRRPRGTTSLLSSNDKWTNLTLNATAGVTCMSHMEACRNSSTCIQMRVSSDYTSCQMYSSDSRWKHHILLQSQPGHGLCSLQDHWH